MKTKEIVFLGTLIALVTASTYIRIHIPIGTGGLIHIGTLTMFIIALRFGARYGAIASGVGMALFDILSEWVIWAPGTLVVRLIAGFVIGKVALSSKGQGELLSKNILALIAGGVIIVVGYFVFEALIIGTGWGAVASIPGNLAQIAIGFFALFILPSIPKLETLSTDFASKSLKK